MPAPRRRSPARFFAPLALIVCAVAVVAVILNSSATGDGDDDTASSPDRSTATGQTQTQPARRTRATYTIKTGDTLGAIAERTGTTVEQLQDLNPALDPQALVAGQKIKLRE